MTNGAIETVLWPGLHGLEPTSQLGGILARKPGYHNSRDHLPSDDYSVREFAIDRVGPADLGSAIDWTFPEAQSGDYRRIQKYSKRLLVAGQTNDPRAYPLREFFGQTDGDSLVEGWDFAKNRASTSADKSHLWHIHKSVHRKYINDPIAMRSILSILQGDDLVTTQAEFNDLMDSWWNGRMSPNAASNAARTALRVAPWNQGVGAGGAEPSTLAVLLDLRSRIIALAGDDDVDEAAIVSGLLAVLTPEAIAAGIPAGIAEQVVENLAARLDQ